MVKKFTNYLKHLLIHLFSFILNYLVFVVLIIFINKSNVFSIQIVNLLSWIVSMLFIFFMDKLFVPDLVNENNSSELHKFVLIRVLSLIIEVVVLFIFVSVLQLDYHMVKLISLTLLFILNHFYVTHIQFN